MYKILIPHEQIIPISLVIVDCDPAWLLDSYNILEIEIDIDRDKLKPCIVDIIVIFWFHSHDTFFSRVVLDLPLDAGFITLLAII